CAHPAKPLPLFTGAAQQPAKKASQQSSPPTINANLEFSFFTAPLNNGGTFYTQANGQFTVPPAPSLSSGQLMYFYNGMVPLDSGSVIQSVLQWGVNSAGGGNFWGIASWYVLLNGSVGGHSTLQAVSSGDVVTGLMYASPGTCTS